MLKYTVLVLSLMLSCQLWAGVQWTTGEAKVNGKPVTYKILSHAPQDAVKKNMQWLLVISWKYDGTVQNGMPSAKERALMDQLETGLAKIVGHTTTHLDIYSATGNNHKERMFYVSDRKQFMEQFNQALKGHPQYPIQIRFYQDEKWSDLESLQKRFGA